MIILSAVTMKESESEGWGSVLKVKTYYFSHVSGQLLSQINSIGHIEKRRSLIPLSQYNIPLSPTLNEPSVRVYAPPISIHVHTFPSLYHFVSIRLTYTLM